MTFSSSMSPLLETDDPRRLGTDQGVRRALTALLLPARHLIAQGREETVELLLHAFNRLLHLENDLDPREIHPEIARQAQNPRQALHVIFGVEPRVALGA